MLFALISVVVFFNLLFLISIKVQDNSIADVGWGISFVIFSVILYHETEFPSLSQGLMTLLIVVWGLRLSTHIYLRNQGRGEDFRYLEWRNQWGKSFFIRSYLQVYMLQMLVMLIIATPIAIAYFDPIMSDGFVVVGMIIALYGLVIEVIADWQLSQFKRNPANKGKLMTRGLWSWSRHPNYFGEACFWWGIACFVLSSNYGYLGLISPIVITFLLRYVSGVPMLEKKYEKRQDFKTYAKNTACFVPFVKRF